MSSDNGIYILMTKRQDNNGYEYRVAHAQGIDNIYYDVATGTHKEDFVPQEAFRYFKDCKVFGDRRDALGEADRQAAECSTLEYGVSMLEHPDQPFTTFSEEEMEFHDGEIEKLFGRERERRARELRTQAAKREAATICLPAGTKVCPGACHGVLFTTPEGKEIRGTLYLPELTLVEEVDFLPNDWNE